MTLYIIQKIDLIFYKEFDIMEKCVFRLKTAIVILNNEDYLGIKVATFFRNGWQFSPESVATLNRNVQKIMFLLDIFIYCF